MGAELFHADGRTDTTKLIVAFRNFANAPKTATVTFKNVFKHYNWSFIIVSLGRHIAPCLCGENYVSNERGVFLTGTDIERGL